LLRTQQLRLSRQMLQAVPNAIGYPGGRSVASSGARSASNATKGRWFLKARSLAIES